MGSKPNDNCKKARQKTQRHGDTQKGYHVLTEAETGVIQQPVKNSQELIITNKSWGAMRKDSPSEPPRGKQTLAFRTSDFWKRTIKNLCSLKSLSSCHLLQQPQEAHTDYIWRDDSKPQHHRELGVLEGMRRCGDTDGGQQG